MSEQLAKALARIEAQAINRRELEGRKPPGIERTLLAREAVAYEDAAQIIKTELAA